MATSKKKEIDIMTDFQAHGLTDEDLVTSDGKRVLDSGDWMAKCKSIAHAPIDVISNTEHFRYYFMEQYQANELQKKRNDSVNANPEFVIQERQVGKPLVLRDGEPADDRIVSGSMVGKDHPDLSEQVADKLMQMRLNTRNIREEERSMLSTDGKVKHLLKTEKLFKDKKAQRVDITDADLSEKAKVGEFLQTVDATGGLGGLGALVNKKMRSDYQAGSEFYTDPKYLKQQRSAKPKLISYDQRDSVNVKQVFGHPTA